MRTAILASAATAVLAGAAGVWAVSAGGAGASGWEAEAVLRDAWGTRLGTVSFEGDEGHTSVRLKLAQVPGITALDAFHGFHIHANADAANGSGCIADPGAASSTWFVSADGHWKEDPGSNHAAHSGDMPSALVLAGGTADLRFRTGRFDPADLEGRAVILHAGPDNFGNVPVGAGANQYTATSAGALSATANTGNAGDRLACGVISLG